MFPWLQDDFNACFALNCDPPVSTGFDKPYKGKRPAALTRSESLTHAPVPSGRCSEPPAALFAAGVSLNMFPVCRKRVERFRAWP